MFDSLYGLFANSTFWVAIEALATAGALIYLAQQNISMRKSYKFDAQWRQKEKASEMARYYADSLIPRIGYCLAVLKESTAIKLLSGIDSRKMEAFNSSELSRLLPNYTAEALNAAIQDKIAAVPIERYLQIREYFLPEQYRCASLDSSQAEKIDPAREFRFVMNDLLNDMEYFSMCMNCRIADDTVVYQSLHQSFFKIVEILYFKIASANHDAKDKYFTEIIKLYLKWQTDYAAQIEAEKRSERQIAGRSKPVT